MALVGTIYHGRVGHSSSLRLRQRAVRQLALRGGPSGMTTLRLAQSSLPFTRLPLATWLFHLMPTWCRYQQLAETHYQVSSKCSDTWAYERSITFNLCFVHGSKFIYLRSWLGKSAQVLVYIVLNTRYNKPQHLIIY